MNLPGIKHRLISGFSIAGALFAAFFFLPDAGAPFVVAAIAALLALFLSRHLFDYSKPLSQIAFGLIFGGIVGNLIDRLHAGHVIDFIYFYTERGGREIGFPAFNVADSAICTGVGLVFLITWLNDREARRSGAAPAKRAAE